MLPLIPLAISVAPMLARWIFGEGGAKVAEQVGAVVSSVTGVADPHTAEGVASVEAALQGKPELAMQLQAELAKIAAEREAEHDKAIAEQRSAEIEEFKAQLADTAGARQQTIDLAKSGSAIAWGAPIVSVVVLATFAACMWMAFNQVLPPGSETILNVLLGTLGGLATAVVSYWVGSSIGSKNANASLAVIAQSVAASSLPRGKP